MGTNKKLPTVRKASELSNRSQDDLLAQRMVRQIQLLEVQDRRKKNYILRLVKKKLPNILLLRTLKNKLSLLKN